jgi:septal ring-binding cell division protein DamX
MANSRVKERFELAMDARQVVAVLLGSLVILGGVFVLGITVGRQQAPPAAAAATIAAPRDALAHLDDAMAPKAEEPAPVLKAHQALTDGRAIEKTLPVPQVKTTAVTIAAQAPPAATPPAADPVIQPPPAPAAAPATRSPPAPAAAVAASAAPRRSADKAKPAQRVARAEAARKGTYAIQVASVPRRADAERLARKLSGQHPRIVTADIPGKGRWYRVLVGSYESQDAAKREVASLTRSGVHGIVTAMR